MALVPKQVAQVAYREGWKVVTDHNLRYGSGASARMVTFIFEFRWDSRANVQPLLVYRESLAQALQKAGEIAQDGSIS